MPQNIDSRAEQIREILLSIFSSRNGIYTQNITIINETQVSKITYELRFSDCSLQIAFVKNNDFFEIEYVSCEPNSLYKISEISNYFFKRLSPETEKKIFHLL